MHPELFTFHGFEITAYSFFSVLAALAVFGGVFWLAGKKEMPRLKIAVLLIAMILGAFFGARALHVALNRGLYQGNPALIFALSFQGFSLYGGALLSALIGIVMSQKLKISPWKLGDTAAPFIGLGIALMRVGCFLNGCCFGKVTSLPWGVRFPALSQAHIFQLSSGEGNILSTLPVHPTQLYEMLATLLASVMAIYIIRKKHPDGTAILSFIIFFTAWRWVSYSFFRALPTTFDASPYFYPLLYGVIILVSLVFLAKKAGAGAR